MMKQQQKGRLWVKCQLWVNQLRQLSLPSLRVGKRVVIRVIAWVTDVETTIRKTGAAYGGTAAGSRVRVCGHGPRPRLNAGPCLWRTAPIQYCSVTCGAICVFHLQWITSTIRRCAEKVEAPFWLPLFYRWNRPEYIPETTLYPYKNQAYLIYMYHIDSVSVREG